MTVLYLFVCRRCRQVSEIDDADVASGLIPVHACGRRMRRATDEDLEKYAYVKDKDTNPPAHKG